MSPLRSVWTVASFEFLRVWKPKDILITLAMFVSGGLFLAWVKGADAPHPKVTIAVVGEDLGLPDSDGLPFRFFQMDGFDEEELRAKVASGTIGPVLFARPGEDPELLVRDEEPAWYAQLVSTLREARRDAKVRASGLSPEVLAEILSEQPIDLSVQARAEQAHRAKLEVLAGACVIAMMLGLFMGSIHLFTSITGEKQNHVTESVLVAIPVQTWIDGKCVGLTLVSSVGLLTIGACWWVANQVYGLFREPLQIPFEIVDFPMFLGFLAFAILGFVMWFAFFAMLAATIDDPNTSSRGIFMFLPAVAAGAGFVGVELPDSGFFRFASVFPLTSPSAMPVRLVIGNPAGWEVALALALLVGAAWLFRSAAAKVFAMAMLMRGKELAWREIWRAFRHA